MDLRPALSLLVSLLSKGFSDGSIGQWEISLAVASSLFAEYLPCTIPEHPSLHPVENTKIHQGRAGNEDA